MWLLNLSCLPKLISCINALVAVCNLSVIYYFPTWFWTVMLTSASIAGKFFFFFGHHCGGWNIFDRPSSVTEFYLYFNRFFIFWVSGIHPQVFSAFLIEVYFLVFFFVLKMDDAPYWGLLNMMFEILPLFTAILMTRMTEDSHPAYLWLSIVKIFFLPLGF